MKEALFINGVYETVLKEIIEAQKLNKDMICFLQPYTPYKITHLNKQKPSKNNPIELYISITTNLDKVCYVASIVGWEDKRALTKERLENLNNHIETFQSSEEEIYLQKESGKEYVNLISVLNVCKVPNQFSVINLIKTSNEEPYNPRTRAGGFSYVWELPNWINVEQSILQENLNKELEESVKQSQADSDEARKKRLKNASRKPKSVQVISHAYKRNPDVIVEVLKRANGFCERCGKAAPFIRAKDNSPYLEIHHKTMLADKGDDTVDNAIGVCPNCHRELHFGVNTVL